MGVQLINLGKKDAVVGIARNADSDTAESDIAESENGEVEAGEVEPGEAADADDTSLEPEATAVDDAEQAADDRGTVSGAEPTTPDEA